MTAGPPAHLVRQLLVERAREGAVEEALWGRCCGGGLRASMFNGGCENRGQTDCKLIKQPRSKAEITGATFCVFCCSSGCDASLRRPRRLPGYISFLKLKCECTRKIWQRIFFFSSYFSKEIRFQTTPIPPFPGFQHLLSVCFFFLNT